jgi:hypothetical protein
MSQGWEDYVIQADEKLTAFIELEPSLRTVHSSSILLCDFRESLRVLSGALFACCGYTHACQDSNGNNFAHRPNE